MSTAWEITLEDLATVLNAHRVVPSEKQLQMWLDEVIDHDLIEDRLLHYCDMEAQTDSMLDDIEDQLMNAGIIPKGDKKFTMKPDDEYKWFGEDEDDED